jgi:hypothetical protein
MPWFKEWDPQSLADYLSSMAPVPPTPMTDWVADSGATNHTPPHPGHISPRPPSLAHPSSIIVGNGYVLPVYTARIRIRIRVLVSDRYGYGDTAFYETI